MRRRDMNDGLDRIFTKGRDFEGVGSIEAGRMSRKPQRIRRKKVYLAKFCQRSRFTGDLSTRAR